MMEGFDIKRLRDSIKKGKEEKEKEESGVMKPSLGYTEEEHKAAVKDLQDAANTLSEKEVDDFLKSLEKRRN